MSSRADALPRSREDRAGPTACWEADRDSEVGNAVDDTWARGKGTTEEGRVECGGLSGRGYSGTTPEINVRAEELTTGQEACEAPEVLASFKGDSSGTDTWRKPMVGFSSPIEQVWVSGKVGGGGGGAGGAERPTAFSF